jgi:hypothetical protein
MLWPTTKINVRKKHESGASCCCGSFTACKKGKTQFALRNVYTILGCGLLSRISNGLLRLLPSSSTENLVAELRCHPGYTESAPRIKCLPSGNWEATSCDPKGKNMLIRALRVYQVLTLFK